MTPDEAHRLATRSLKRVAPDVDTTSLDGAADLRDDLGLDSLDFLRLVGELSEGLGARIEEDDYHELSTLDDCVAYLVRRSTGSVTE